MYIVHENQKEKDFKIDKNSSVSFISSIYWVSTMFQTILSAGVSSQLSMGFFEQEYWSALPFLPPGDLPDPGIKPMFPASPEL